MKTIEHFKDLYKKAKEEGVIASLKHDAFETARKHADILVGIGMLIDPLFYTIQISRYTRTEEEVIPPNDGGLSLRQIVTEPVYERVSRWK
ncbi:MAG: hypothetical protein NT001_04570 [Candidatus Woesearchaeota archaeon]|nr:hypothetical protein [Candidatus Woesearchaeota archaeon]